MSKRSSYAGSDMSGATAWRQHGAFQVMYDRDDPAGLNEGKVDRRYSYVKLGNLSQRKFNKKDNDIVQWRYNGIDNAFLRERIVNVPRVLSNNTFSPSGFLTVGGTTGGQKPVFEYPLFPQLDAPRFTGNGTTTFTWERCQRMPMLICQLTDCPNVVAPSTTNTRKDICYPVVTSTGSVTFNNAVAGFTAAGTYAFDRTLQSIDNEGSDTAAWTIHQSDGYEYPRGRAILNRSVVSLEMYGQYYRPTEFNVYAVQFHENCGPWHLFPGTDAATEQRATMYTEYANGSQAAKWWKDWFKKLVFHPSHDSVTAKDVGMKVLYHKRYQIEPTTSAQESSSFVQPQMIADRMNFEFQRMVNFNWAGGADTTNVFDDTWGNSLANNKIMPEEKARIYLVVTASNYFDQVGGQVNVSDNNSYDLGWIPGINFDIKNVWTIGS